MPQSMTEISQSLKELRLFGIQETLDARSLQVQEGKMSFLEGLSMLLQDELDRKRSRLNERRFKGSGLKERKTMDEFDWGFNPKVPRKTALELLTLRFIKPGEDALLIGNPGTGKSHIAKVIAHKAIEENYRVVYKEAHVLFEDLFEAAQIGRRKNVYKQFVEADLFIVDDLFLRKRIPEIAADDFQDLIMDRYSARKSTLITSNRILDDWGKCLGDNAVGSAILDRLLHRGHLLKFEGKSWRLKEAASRVAKEQRKV